MVLVRQSTFYVSVLALSLKDGESPMPDVKDRPRLTTPPPSQETVINADAIMAPLALGMC